MPVNLTEMRDLLLPGLLEIRTTYAALPTEWATMFTEAEAAPLPSVSLPVAIAMGAAAVVIKNPEIERREMWNWLGRFAQLDLEEA